MRNVINDDLRPKSRLRIDFATVLESCVFNWFVVVN